ncbi:phage integrase N-terminal SAM-like domain-containing protein [Alloalcanivorax mobilis]|uniref:phage integrase N-terminal SAM-like domain-containing protein n=1 Tax=Alloalcanivorax mobilis TaxID=2019569 RepID=UPI000C75B551|nr:phage integrase N-terminal SAM-like domain-containing protein [Alloalcanivorax mobilis]
MHKDRDGQPRLRDQFRDAIRVRHYSPRTEKTYWYWIRYFIRFHQLRHPSEMAEPEVSAFLSWLATKRNVAAATQNQALNALVFLYRHVIKAPLGERPFVAAADQRLDSSTLWYLASIVAFRYNSAKPLGGH